MFNEVKHWIIGAVVFIAVVVIYKKLTLPTPGAAHADGTPVTAGQPYRL